MFKAILKDFRQISFLLAAEMAAIGFMAITSPSDIGIFLLDMFIISGVIFMSLENALLFFIVSLPFFAVVPGISDSFSIWRILVAILAIRFAWNERHQLALYLRSLFSKNFINEIKKLSWLNRSLILFFGFSLLSALNARYFLVALKQIFFWGNMVVFGYLAYHYVKTRTNLHKIIFAFIITIGEILAVGMFQFYLGSVWPLFNFWQFWAQNIIPIFYGQKLSHLLSYSNTWFSYFPDAPAVLRMFSVFPDSHSFSMYLVLGIIFVGFMVFESMKFNKKHWIKIGLLSLSLLGIILSASRGVWVGILLPAAAFFALYFFKKGDRKIPLFMLSLVLTFVLIFPVASMLASLTQKYDTPSENDSQNLFFKRMFSVVDTEETSNKGRIEIWRETVFFIKDSPLLGVGPGNFPLVLDENIANAKKGASAHNLYLQMIAESGAVGFVFFALTILSIFAIIYRLCFDVRMAEFRMLGFFYAFGFLWALGYGMFDVVLLNDKVFLFFAAQIGILYALYKKTDIHYHRAIYSPEK
jgi:O-antigen ligase